MSQTDFIHGDRRLERRYEYRMDLKFSFTHAGLTHFGSGYTVDLSRRAVRFAARFDTEDSPPVQTVMELRISWPFLLQDVCPLELIVRGIVLETTARGTVVSLNHYEFRTCGTRSFDQAPAMAGCSSIVA